MTDDIIRLRYTSGEYHEHNPSWDLEDSPWKAARVQSLLAAHGIRPRTLAEVGCGAGAVLAALRPVLPETELYGFDIAPAAARFWERHAPARIHFELGDFFEVSQRCYDIVLVLDVLEHLANPFDFLVRLLGHAPLFVFHFPLDLSAVSVLRESPLLYVRDKVGHLHYFTKGLALALLEECGYEVVGSQYTGAAFSAPQRTWRTQLGGLARRLTYAMNKDFGVRLLGGETLMVLAKHRSTP